MVIPYFSIVQSLYVPLQIVLVDVFCILFVEQNSGQQQYEIVFIEGTEFEQNRKTKVFYIEVKSMRFMLFTIEVAR